jgi:hypothetical protein
MKKMTWWRRSRKPWLEALEDRMAPATVQFALANESLLESAGTFAVAVTLSAPLATPTMVPFTLGGSAVAGTDYSGVTASPLSIPAGQTGVNITGTLLDDGSPDANKTLTFTLGTPTGATLGSVTVNTLTIAEAAPSPVRLSISNSSVVEPAPGGTVNMVFTVTRTGDLMSQVTVGYTTVPGTAQASPDFTPTTGTTTFASGSAIATIAIPILGNGVVNNPSLTFSVQLTGIVNVVGPPVTFGGGGTTFVGSRPISVAVGDLNGDGKPDIVFSNVAATTVGVLLNTTPPGATTPTFATQQLFAVGADPLTVGLTDVNGDGKLDIVAVNNTSATVSVLLNTTAPGATTASFATQMAFDTGAAPQGLAVADLNGDGRPDLIVANKQDGTVSVLLNTTVTDATVPSFATQQNFAVGSSPVSVAVGDLNGDGKPDLVVANLSAGTVSVLLNTTMPGATAASFATQMAFATGVAPQSVAVADLNGDGRPDLVVANQGDNTVGVLLNTTTPGATTPSFATQQTFATGTNPKAVAVADLNGDGKADLVITNVGSPGSESVLVNTTAPGAISLSFAPQQTFAVGDLAYSVALGDLNGDGAPDIVSIDESKFGAGSVAVLLNTTVLGAATLTPAFPQAATLATGSGPNAVAVVDLNGDGKPDLVVGNDNDSTVSVLLNTSAPGSPTPTFAPAQTFAIASGVYSLAVGDLNGDGKPDLVVGNGQTSGAVTVLLNTTTPGDTTTFAPQQTFAVGSTPVWVAVADVNGDGKPDLIVANSSDNTVSVLLNTTTPGALTPSFATQQPFALGSNSRSVVVGDVNGDGMPDLLVANSSDNTVSVLLNTTTPGATTPSFAIQQAFAAGAGPDTVAVGDLNGDGKPDLVVANLSAGTVSVLLNTTVPGAATLSFVTQQPFAVGNKPRSVAVGDVNGDGKPDLIVANSSDNTVSVLLNTTPPEATTATFATQQTFATGAGPASAALADVNGDGRPDVVVANQGDATVSVLVNSPVTMPGNTATGAIAETDGLTAGERYAQALYVAEMGRPGSQTELGAWAPVLTVPGGTAAAVSGIMRNPEATARLITSWYHTFLGRGTTGGEVMGWARLLQQGQTEELVLSELLWGPTGHEFYDRAQTLIPTGSADERYVQALYQLLLHRSARIDELQIVVRALAQVGRQGVAMSVLQSPEYRTLVVEGYYTILLHHSGTAADVAAWVNSGLDLASIRLHFETGSEFFTNG